MFDELFATHFSGSIFSQMNNLCSNECLYLKILVCEMGMGLQMPHRILTVPIIIGLIYV